MLFRERITRSLCGNRSGSSEPSLHFFVPNKPRLLKYQSAAGKHREVRYAPNIETCRKLRIFFRIHFEHHSLARHFRRGSRHFRCCGMARPAPFGPKIHQHRHSNILDHFIE
jgi:hypothetical protein